MDGPLIKHKKCRRIKSYWQTDMLTIGLIVNSHLTVGKRVGRTPQYPVNVFVYNSNRFFPKILRSIHFELLASLFITLVCFSCVFYCLFVYFSLIHSFLFTCFFISLVYFFYISLSFLSFFLFSFSLFLFFFLNITHKVSLPTPGTTIIKQNYWLENCL